MPREKHYTWTDVLPDDITCSHRSEDTDNAFFGMQSYTYHQHDGYEMYLLVNGSLTYYSETQGYEIGRADLLLIPPYLFHTKDMTKVFPYERIVINFRDRILPATINGAPSPLLKCFQDAGTGSYLYLHLDEQEFQSYVHLADKLSYTLQSREYAARELAISYLVELLVMVNRKAIASDRYDPDNQMPDVVSGVLNYIDHNLSGQISMDLLEEKLHHNAVYIERCFKKVTGISIKQFVLKKRIHLAKTLLEEGCSAQAACEQSGFNDYANFSRTFSQRVGCSPREYQKRNEADL